MGDEEEADPLLHLGLPDHRLDPIGQIDDLFAVAGADVQDFTHMHSSFPNLEDELKVSLPPLSSFNWINEPLRADKRLRKIEIPRVLFLKVELSQRGAYLLSG